jgi:hypothetical protein
MVEGWGLVGTFPYMKIAREPDATGRFLFAMPIADIDARSKCE